MSPGSTANMMLAREGWVVPKDTMTAKWRTQHRGQVLADYKDPKVFLALSPLGKATKWCYLEKEFLYHSSIPSHLPTASSINTMNSLGKRKEKPHLVRLNKKFISYAYNS